MGKYAANRVYQASSQKMYRNQIVEIDDTTHEVVRMMELSQEICQTEWKGGLILLLRERPVKVLGETLSTFLDRINSIEQVSESKPVNAYHVTAFDVSSMEFTIESRIIFL